MRSRGPPRRRRPLCREFEWFTVAASLARGAESWACLGRRHNATEHILTMRALQVLPPLPLLYLMRNCTLTYGRTGGARGSRNYSRHPTATALRMRGGKASIRRHAEKRRRADSAAYRTHAYVGE